MDRINRFSIKKFIFSCVYNAVVLISALLIFIPFFEENDDTQIAMIVEGVFGVKEWHVIYPNFILGKLYVLLQTIIPNVRWHVVLQYVFIYISYVLLVYVISKHKRGMFISIVAVLGTFYEMYVSLQYTKTAAFCCIAAFVLIYEYVRNNTVVLNAQDRLLNVSKNSNKSENRLFIIAAFTLVIYGALLRPESVFIAAVPAFAAGLLELSRTKNIKKYLLMFIPLFAIVLLLSALNSYVYTKDADWDRFMKYNKARMELNDYRYDILDFTKYADELNELNVSENDAYMILTYQYGDDEVFSLERFLEIRNAFGDKEFGYKTFANLYENLIKEIRISYVMLAGLVGIIIVLAASIITDRSKSSPGFITDAIRKINALILTIIFCFAAVLYFQYSGRFSHRLFASIIIPTIFAICYMMDSIHIRDNDSKIVFGGNKNDITIPACIVIIIVLIGLNGLKYIENSNDYLSYADTNEKIVRELDEISKDKDSLYVADTFTFQNVFKYEVFDTFEEGELSNFVTCGSWYINSPITKRVTRQYGYENPFEALRSESDNVYLLDNTGVEYKTLFLKEHYGKVVEAEKIENRGGIDVFSIASSEK